MTKRETYISRQAKRLSKGQIDRRRFVMSALATGVTMPTAMSLASRAEAMTPKRGGTLRYALAGPSAAKGGLFPGSWSEMHRIANLARGGRLVTRTAKGALSGDLAEHFHSDDGGLSRCLRSSRGSSKTRPRRSMRSCPLGRLGSSVASRDSTGAPRSS